MKTPTELIEIARGYDEALYNSLREFADEDLEIARETGGSMIAQTSVGNLFLAPAGDDGIGVACGDWVFETTINKARDLIIGAYRVDERLDFSGNGHSDEDQEYEDFYSDFY